MVQKSTRQNQKKIKNEPCTVMRITMHVTKVFSGGRLWWRCAPFCSGELLQREWECIGNDLEPGCIGRDTTRCPRSRDSFVYYKNVPPRDGRRRRRRRKRKNMAETHGLNCLRIRPLKDRSWLYLRTVQLWIFSNRRGVILKGNARGLRGEQDQDRLQGASVILWV